LIILKRVSINEDKYCTQCASILWRDFQNNGYLCVNCGFFLEDKLDNMSQVILDYITQEENKSTYNGVSLYEIYKHVVEERKLASSLAFYSEIKKLRESGKILKYGKRKAIVEINTDLKFTKHNRLAKIILLYLEQTMEIPSLDEVSLLKIYKHVVEERMLASSSAFYSEIKKLRESGKILQYGKRKAIVVLETSSKDKPKTLIDEIHSYLEEKTVTNPNYIPSLQDIHRYIVYERRLVSYSTFYRTIDSLSEEIDNYRNSGKMVRRRKIKSAIAQWKKETLNPSGNHISKIERKRLPPIVKKKRVRKKRVQELQWFNVVPSARAPNNKPKKITNKVKAQIDPPQLSHEEKKELISNISMRIKTETEERKNINLKKKADSIIDNKKISNYADRGMMINYIHNYDINKLRKDPRALLMHLKHPNETVRYSVLIKYTKLSNKELVPFLIPLLEDKSMIVKRGALQAIGSNGTLNELPVLQKYLKNQKFGVKSDSRLAINKIRNREYS
jgi:hypothetical protein